MCVCETNTLSPTCTPAHIITRQLDACCVRSGRGNVATSGKCACSLSGVHVMPLLDGKRQTSALCLGAICFCKSAGCCLLLTPGAGVVLCAPVGSLFHSGPPRAFRNWLLSETDARLGRCLNVSGCSLQITTWDLLVVGFYFGTRLPDGCGFFLNWVNCCFAEKVTKGRRRREHVYCH